MKKYRGNALLSLGIIFLIVGLIQQDFGLSFTSGAFNIGIIFVISGLVGTAVDRKSSQEDQ